MDGLRQLKVDSGSLAHDEGKLVEKDFHEVVDHIENSLYFKDFAMACLLELK